MTIRYYLDEMRREYNNLTKDTGTLLGQVLVDIDKELKTEPDYFKKEMSKTTIDLFQTLTRIENMFASLEIDYKRASKEPEQEDEEEIELPF